MPEKIIPPATGLQIAFFVCALLLLAAPADKFLFSHWTWARAHELPVSRVAIFAIAAAILFGMRPLRRICLDLLSVPVPRDRRAEVGAALALNVAAAFAAIGAVMLWTWLAGGDPALARRVGEQAKDTEQMSYALSLGGVLTFLVIGGLIAPPLQGTVVRRLLFSPWGLPMGLLTPPRAPSLPCALPPA